ncbi:MAG: hypothetical protein ABN482_14570 [Corticimicrobacter sp.]
MSLLDKYLPRYQFSERHTIGGTARIRMRCAGFTPYWNLILQ